MLTFAALTTKCLTNNLCKFHQKILNYSENNEIFVGGCFFRRTLYMVLGQTLVAVHTEIVLMKCIMKL